MQSAKKKIIDKAWIVNIIWCNYSFELILVAHTGLVCG